MSCTNYYFLLICFSINNTYLVWQVKGKWNRFLNIHTDFDHLHFFKYNKRRQLYLLVTKLTEKKEIIILRFKKSDQNKTKQKVLLNEFFPTFFFSFLMLQLDSMHSFNSLCLYHSWWLLTIAWTGQHMSVVLCSPVA